MPPTQPVRGLISRIWARSSISTCRGTVSAGTAAGRNKRYGQQRESVDMANLVYAGTVDERVYQKLSERMKNRYDVLGSIPDTIKDFWIDSIEQMEKDLGKFTRPESPADLFSLRYEDLSGNKDDREWDVWTKVVAMRDIDACLTCL